MTFEISNIFDPPVSPPPPSSSSKGSKNTKSSSNVLANMFDTIFGGQEVETEVTNPQTVVTSAEKGAIAATIVSVVAAAAGGFGAFFLISRRNRGENMPLLS